MSEGLRNWVFGSTVKTEDGGVKMVALVKASDTPIRRHTKIKGAANPFDPAWEEYFENRFGLQMKDNPRGKKPIAHPLVYARRTVPELSRKDYEGNRMENPLHPT